MQENHQVSKQTSKILLVDDEHFILNIYDDLFQNNGFETYKATDGKEALEYIMNEKFDIVLLDIFMPNMDGVALLQNLKNSPPSFRQGKILVTTNYEPDSIQELQDLYKKYNNNPLELGVYDHIIKANIDLDDLLSLVKNYL